MKTPKLSYFQQDMIFWFILDIFLIPLFVKAAINGEQTWGLTVLQVGCVAFMHVLYALDHLLKKRT